MDVYRHCPVLANERYLLRQVEEADCADLLRVYSDEKAAVFFNGDNCHGDDFRYSTAERMAEAIRFWLFSYEHRYFVRWSVMDRCTAEAVGTVEMFHRGQDDTLGSYGILRLDLRSDYERTDEIECVLELILPVAHDLFGCESVLTKAVPQAAGRRIALAAMGFQPTERAVVGEDGTAYGDYWLARKKPYVSYCGMRCDQCLIYRPNVVRKDRRREIVSLWRKIWKGFEADPQNVICDGCRADHAGAVLFSADCPTRKCVKDRKLRHCGECGRYPCSIFPAEPEEAELEQKIDIEKRWTWDEEVLMEAYCCKRNMDAFRAEQK